MRYPIPAKLGGAIGTLVWTFTKFQCGWLAIGPTADALTAYERDQQVRVAPAREAAREALLAAWQGAEERRTGDSRLLLAYTRADMHTLNTRARELRRSLHGRFGR